MVAEKSPNAAIDKAIKALMTSMKNKEGKDAMPPDVMVKIINTAIAWEKVKHQIKDEEEFDPASIT